MPNTRQPRYPGRNFRKARYRPAASNPRRGVNIDPQRFINQSTIVEDTTPYVPRHKFSMFAFDPRLHAAIVAKGYTQPTPIQDKVIAPILAGKDVVGIANTGTGKTAGFVLPLINRLLPRQDTMVLIVTPTRELAQQIDDEFRSFAGQLRLNSVVCVGGLKEGPQIRGLKANPRVVIGTPGRLKDFVQQGHLKLDRIQTFVLDEADRMLDMGFLKDMKFLMHRLPEERQSLCFSATMTPAIEKIVEDLLFEPTMISVVTRETAEHVNQDVIHADTPAEKLGEIERMLSLPDYSKVLIFVDTKHGAQRLSDRLEKKGIKATAIHGNKNQNQRQRALDAFKTSDVQVLVATDVAARGLDVPAVSHVINYDQPKAYDDYIHRIGRTGRAGMAGQALTFVPRAAVR